MELVSVIVYAIFTFLTFKKYPTPAMVLVWGISGLFMLFSFIGVVNVSIMFLMFIFMVITLMLSAIFTGLKT